MRDLTSRLRRLQRSKGSLLTREDETFLLNIRSNDKALEILVESNIGLVRSIANKYGHIGYSMEDMVSAGTRGLLIAIERHDGSTKLSTYAYNWIRKYILEEIENNHRSIRLPSHIHETQTKVNKAIGSGAASITDICEMTNLPPERIVKAMEAFAVSTCPINEELDGVKDCKHNPGSMDILEALDELTPDQRDCLLYFIGLSDDVPPFDEDQFQHYYNQGLIKIKELMYGENT